jgi:hypothetical protein
LRDIDSASRAMTLLRIYEARISEAGPVVIEVSDA